MKISPKSENVLKALSSSTRRTIMKKISESRSATYTEIMHVLGLDPSLESGRFNYHLKELSEAGLIERTNGEYKITDTGKSALILVDQITRESKGEVQVDRFGVLSAAMSMSPRTELTLFASQMGFMFGSMVSILTFALITISDALTPGLMVPILFLPLFIGFPIALISIVKMIGILRRLKVGFSVILFLGKNWFLIRSPNRNTFFLLMITIAGTVICGVLTIIFPYVSLIELFSIQWYGLIVCTLVFTFLTVALFISAKTKADRLEEMNGEQ
jgi:DNA-binding transcriptional ArsR family regulator